MDGSMVVSAHFDGTIRFWDARSAECARELNTHSREATGVTASPDGTTVLTAGRDNYLKCIDVRTWEVLHTY